MVQPNDPNVNYHFGSDYTTELLSALAKSLRLSANLHVGTDFRYHCTDAEYKAQSIQVAQRLEGLLNRVVDFAKRQATETSITSAITRTQKWRCALESTDNCLEKVDISLDLLNGYDRFAAPKGISAAVDHLSAKQHAAPGRQFGGSVVRDSTVKPQDYFAQKIDNSEAIWKPKLKSKPNAQVPLEESLTLIQPTTSSPTVLPLALEEHISTLVLPPVIVTRPHYPHPYKAELESLTFTPTHLSYKSPIQPDDECECIWVDTEQQVLNLAEDLESQEAFAVDLEHHQYRSYLGLTCLMQISTRARDYLIDTLELRDKLHPLLKAFTDPKIVKVFHGAYRDILWLQRDLGLYVVNMFDTFYASKELEFPKHSFAYLLTHFCAVTTNKKYQLADWRIRPLPKGCLTYARMDTHYLLYIWDRLRNLLIERASEQKLPKTELVLKTLNNSKAVCLQTYVKPVVERDANVTFAAKAWPHQTLTKVQHRVLQRLLEWRDRKARERDESTRYILPLRVLVCLLEKLPQTKDAVKRYWRTSSSDCQSVSKEIRNAVNDRKGSKPDATMSLSVSPRSSVSQISTSTEEDVVGMTADQLGCLSSPLPGTPNWGRKFEAQQEDDAVLLDSQNASCSPITVSIFGKCLSNRPYTKNELCALGIKDELRKGFKIGTHLVKTLKRPIPPGSISSPQKKTKIEPQPTSLRERERSRKRRQNTDRLDLSIKVSKKRARKQDKPSDKTSAPKEPFNYSSTQFGDQAKSGDLKYYT